MVFIVPPINQPLDWRTPVYSVWLFYAYQWVWALHATVDNRSCLVCNFWPSVWVTCNSPLLQSQLDTFNVAELATWRPQNTKKLFSGALPNSTGRSLQCSQDSVAYVQGLGATLSRRTLPCCQLFGSQTAKHSWVYWPPCCFATTLTLLEITCSSSHVLWYAKASACVWYWWTRVFTCLLTHLQENKMKLAAYIEKEYKVTVDPTSLFDMQVKWKILKFCELGKLLVLTFVFIICCQLYSKTPLSG